MTNANENKQPSHNVVARYVEMGWTNSGTVGALWEREDGKLYIRINEMRRRIELNGFLRKPEDRVENGPSHDLVRYYQRGPNAPYAYVGCVYTKDDGTYSIELHDFDLKVRLTAYQRNRDQADATDQQGTEIEAA